MQDNEITQVNDARQSGRVQLNPLTPILGAKQRLKMRPLHRLTVSKPFRELTARTFPALDRNPAYWRFMQYLLFGTFIDEDTGRLIISQKDLAEIEGWTRGMGNYRAIRFLTAFQTEVMTPETFSWTGWRGGKKCRQVQRFDPPASFQTALDEEWAKTHHDQGRVYFCDGRTFSKKKQRQCRIECRNAAIFLQALAPCEEAREILDYLNHLPPNLFSGILRNYHAALQVAQALENENARRQQLRILKAINEQPQPFYAASGNANTDRIFGIGDCLTGLERNVRRALTADWQEGDIKSSQLAICAAAWNVEVVQDFLRDGGSVWKNLFEWFEFDTAEGAKAKPALKDALYSTCYGMRTQYIGGRLGKALEIAGVVRNGSLFLRNPLIQAMLASRNEATKQILRKSGAKTCFGKWLELGKLTPPQILAQIAQAAELKLIYPVVQLAKQTEEFKITLWQHDGFSVHFTRREERWKRKLARVVSEQAEKMGIVTGLEWKD
ncbi:MAG: hypothetical protein WCO94_08640 [Verrucomicrobiota bacterium]